MLGLKNVYVKVFENRFVLKLLEQGTHPLTVYPDNPFTTTRLLVGEFAPAERALGLGIKKLFPRSWLSPSPAMLIHPVEMVEGGLSEVEDRVFRELAAGSGARKVVVWVGEELTDAEAKHRISAR